MSVSEVESPATAPQPNKLGRRGARPGERGIEGLLFIAATVGVVTTVGIIIALVFPTIDFFGDVSIVEFLTGDAWTPLFSNKQYGVLPLLVATLVVTAIATAIAVPLGLGAAIYLAEYARPRVRSALKPILEVLAGVPTVVYGFFALVAIGPLIRDYWPGGDRPSFQNLLIASIAMGIMIVPTVASLAEDAMTAVPRSLRQGAFALASSRMQVATRVVFPAALSGIVAAIVLGISSAIGETMIVTIAGGLVSDRILFNPTEGAATMTAFIAGAGQGDLPLGTVEYKSIFAVGALLFIITFALNIISFRLVRRFREVYE
ncbi:phosphate ABC transporter permease subunit PstC [soil metagenome]